MASFEHRLIDLFETIHPLDRISRAGYVLSGVPEPESVAAHSHFVSLMTLLFLEQHPGIFDEKKALSMALTHDLCESLLMDIPMPTADAHLREVKDEAEQAITEQLLNGFHEKYARFHREFLHAASPEARLLRGLDKAQTMIKVLMYERERKGRLEEFWANPRNFDDYGIAQVSELFEAICREAGHPRPR